MRRRGVPVFGVLPAAAASFACKNVRGEWPVIAIGPAFSEVPKGRKAGNTGLEVRIGRSDRSGELYGPYYTVVGVLCDPARGGNVNGMGTPHGRLHYSPQVPKQSVSMKLLAVAYCGRVLFLVALP